MAHALDQMLVLDYLIANEDRHFNNFGLLRNPDTLEWLGPAPIYDSGSCLGYDKLTAQIRSGRNITCKPFKKTHQDQLRLVTSFDWLDLSKLGGIEQDIREVFAGAEGIHRQGTGGSHRHLGEPTHPDAGDLYPHPAATGGFPLKTMWNGMWQRSMGWDSSFNF